MVGPRHPLPPAPRTLPERLAAERALHGGQGGAGGGAAGPAGRAASGNAPPASPAAAWSLQAPAGTCHSRPAPEGGAVRARGRSLTASRLAGVGGLLPSVPVEHCRRAAEAGATGMLGLPVEPADGPLLSQPGPPVPAASDPLPAAPHLPGRPQASPPSPAADAHARASSSTAAASPCFQRLCRLRASFKRPWHSGRSQAGTRWRRQPCTGTPQARARQGSVPRRSSQSARGSCNGRPSGRARHSGGNAAPRPAGACSSR
mmetsp:Transcript_108715/g.340121  ORF Transcript_108715/g.340121 Transcript_108715/m.340121 type:complete len:260 (-) Transcript_108715:753-1532(-)